MKKNLAYAIALLFLATALSALEKTALLLLYHGSLGDIKAWVGSSSPNLNEDIFIDLRPLMLVADRFDPRAPSAESEENRAIYEYLVQAGARPDPYSCARVGDLERLMTLIEADPEAKDFVTGSGDTLLCAAAKSGSYDSLLYLLSLRLDANGADGAGASPLMYAAAIGRQDMLEKLLSFGAEINASDSNGRSVLRYALLNGEEKAARFLISKGAFD